MDGVCASAMTTAVRHAQQAEHLGEEKNFNAGA
jgi:hypothetical protein